MQSLTTLTNLSPFPNKPCLLLTFPTCKILFDCALDLHPMNFYSPCSMITKPDLDVTDYPNENVLNKKETVAAKRLKRKNSSTDEKDPFLDVLPDETFIDAIPEVNFHFISNIDLSQIDAIFISNWESLKALPYLVENKKLYCPIYSSEPVVSLGGMIIEEMIHFLERVDKNIDDKQWVNLQQWNQTFGEDPKKTIPFKWKNLYNAETLEKTLARITKVAINQPIKVGNSVVVNLHSSGYEIGSCNWLITNGYKKIGYWASSSIQNGYMHEMEIEPFQKLDCLILSSLSTKSVNPNNVISEMCAMTVNTLRGGGNVLFPMEPVGSVYGIIENLVGEMDKMQSSFPIYLISPVASRALAWTNISGHWFNSERREWLFEPKMPFHLSEFIEKKRVFMYNSIHSEFATQYTTPCVVFAGHPSLRIGDAVYFTELWGNDPRNVVILTNSDSDYDKVWAPFGHLLMKPLRYQIDMRLTVIEANKILSTEVNAKKVLISDDYHDVAENLKHTKIIPYKFAQPIDMIPVLNTIQLLCFDETINQKSKGPGGVVQGFLNHLDNEFEFTSVGDLKTADPMTLTRFRGSAADTGGMIHADLPFRKRLKGELTEQKLKNALENAKISSTVSQNRDGSIKFTIKSLSAEITLKENKARIKCSNSSNRRLIGGIIDKLLKNLISDKL